MIGAVNNISVFIVTIGYLAIGCRCKNKLNPIGEGMCKRIPEYPDYGDGVKADEPFCYVHQPSSCPDLKQSEVYNMYGEKYSSFACKQKQGKMDLFTNFLPILIEL